jgi:hypothetical protein
VFENDFETELERMKGKLISVFLLNNLHATVFRTRC